MKFYKKINISMLLVVIMVSSVLFAEADPGDNPGNRDLKDLETDKTKEKAKYAKSLLQKTLLDLSVYHPRVRARARDLLGKMKMADFKDWRYPDPKFGIAFSNFPYKKDFRLQKDRTPMTGIEFKLSQPIPFPGKLTTESNIAIAEVRIARLQLAREKNTLGREFISLLIRHRLQKELLVLSQEIAERVELISASSRSAYAVGKLTLDRVQFVDISSERFSDRIQKQSGKLNAIRADYKYFQFKHKSNGKLPDLNQLSSDSNLAMYMDDLLQYFNGKVCDLNKCSIDVALERAGVAKQNSLRSRAQLDYLPDTEVFASYRKRERVTNDPVIGEDFFSFGVSMKIPLWSALSNHKNVSSRTATRQALKFSEKNVLEKERAELASLGQDLITFQKRLLRYNTRLVPRAQSALESLQESYRSGRSDLYDLLGAYEILYSLKSEALRLEADRDMDLLDRAMIVNSILPQVSARKTGQQSQGEMEL